MFTFKTFHELNRMVGFVVFAFLISLLSQIFTPVNHGVRPAKRAFELKGINKKFARVEVGIVRRARPTWPVQVFTPFVALAKQSRATCFQVHSNLDTAVI